MAESSERLGLTRLESAASTSNDWESKLREHQSYPSRRDDSVLPIMMLASLRAFATHYLELISIALTFDATVVPPCSDEQSILQNKMSALYVNLSPISSPRLVARFLAEIFPNVERILSLKRSRLWEEVEATVKRGGI